MHGRLKKIIPEVNSAAVIIEVNGTDKNLGPFEKIVVRHGPKGSINNLIHDSNAVKQLFDQLRSASDSLTTPQWRASEFPSPPVRGELFRQVEMERAGRFLPLLEQITQQESGPCEVSIHKSDDGHPAYRIMGDPEKLSALRHARTLFARIPVEYQANKDELVHAASPAKVALRPAISPEPRLRPLYCGVSVRNWSTGVTAAPEKADATDILCFVRLGGGAPGFVCRATGLGGHALQKEHRVVQPIKNVGPSDVIGTVTDFNILNAARADNKFDLAVVALEPGIDFLQCFDPQLCLPALRGIVDKKNLYGVVVGGKVLIVCKEAIYRGTVTAIALQNLRVIYGGSTGHIMWHDGMIIELEDKRQEWVIPDQ